jgi:hypothetical protein
MTSRLGLPATRSLVFAPLAWLKLQYFCHAGGTEIGGFGISDAADLLRVVDFVPIRQRSCPVSVAFDDDAVADFVDTCVEAGLPQDRFFRLWIHTHPGSSVMLILGRTGRTLARLSFSAGPGASLLLPVAVDWADWARVVQDPAFSLSTLVARWQAEFAATIKPAISSMNPFSLERPVAPRYPPGPWDDVEVLYFEERDFREPFHEFDPWA